MNSSNWLRMRLEPTEAYLMRTVNSKTGTTSMIVLAALLATGCVQSPKMAMGQTSRPQMSVAPETPEQFLGKVLGRYTANGPRINMSDPKVMDRVFDPSITQLLNAPGWDQEGALNIDLVCVCTDSDIRNMQVTVVPKKDPNHVTAVATFDDMDGKRQLQYDLIKNGQRYKIFNVTADKPSFDLRSFLATPPALQN